MRCIFVKMQRIKDCQCNLFVLVFFFFFFFLFFFFFFLCVFFFFFLHNPQKCRQVDRKFWLSECVLYSTCETVRLTVASYCSENGRKSWTINIVIIFSHIHWYRQDLAKFPGPICSKRRYFNELVKGYFVNYFSGFNIQYSDTFCWKNVSSFCTAKATHIFQQKRKKNSAYLRITWCKL